MPVALPFTAAPSARTGPAAALTALVLLSALACASAQAEKADRYKPMVIEADKDLVADDRRQVVVYNGNAVLSQGTMLLRADRIEVRELPDGYRSAAATGSKAKPANWRERRDVADETVEGSAERIDYDGRADLIRFAGNTVWRRLRRGVVVEEISGKTLAWDNAAGVLTVEGGSTSAANPTGRVRTVLSPRTEPASVPALAPSSAPAGATGLAPVRSLDERR